MTRATPVLACLLLACSHASAPSITAPRPLGAAATPARRSIELPTEASLLADVTWLSAPERQGRRAGESGDAASRAWVANRFASLGLVPLGDHGTWNQTFPLGDHGTWNQTLPLDGTVESANVLGWLPGQTSDWVLVGAHLDHLGTDASGRMFPGADDNASGIAAMLGVAAASVRDKTRQIGILFVAFGAEELGLVGSQWLAEHLPKPQARCVGVINLDMVGRSPFLGAKAYALPKALLGIEPGPAVGALANPRNNALLPIARTACDAAGIKLLAAEDFPRLESSIRDEAANRSDDAPFAALGLPTLFFSTSLQDEYHQPSDTVDKIDPATLLRVTSCVRGLVHEVSGAEP